MKQILVVPVSRAGSTCVKEIDLGNKVINTLQTLPKLQTKSDVKLFFEKQRRMPDFDGVVLELWSLQELSKALFVGDGQKRIDGDGLAITKAKIAMDQKALVIDPSSEEIHYPYPLGKDRVTGTKRNRLDAMMSIKGFPKLVKDVLSISTGDAAWKTLESKKLILSYIDWYIQTCARYKADVILPPAPMIDGSSTKMIELCKIVNEGSRTAVGSGTDAYSASYIPILSDAFNDEKSPQRILDMIEEIARPHSIIALKFYRSGEFMEQAMFRRRVRDFLMAIDTLKKENHDNLAIMVLDTKTEGLAYFGNGVDLTCDPMGGVKDRPRRGKKRQKDEDTGDEVENLPEEYKHFGKYFHPDMREFLTIPELRSVIDPSGKLPHKCDFCDSLEGCLTKEKDDPGFPTQERWNSGRRLHNFVCRREEDEAIREMIAAGDARAVELFLKQEKRGNKNLIDLMP